MDVAALSVAIVSLVLAALSLGWQIAQFLLTGARVRAGLKAGLLGSGGALVWPVTTRQVDVERYRQQGFTDPVFAIEVRNTGRMSIAVEQVKVRFEGWGAEFHEPEAPYNPPSPTRLEPHSSKTWYVNADTVKAAARSAIEAGMATRPLRACGVAALGDGKRVTTRERVTVEDGDQKS